MRTILMAIIATFVIGLTLPSAANAASGDYDQSPGSPLYRGGNNNNGVGNNRFRSRDRNYFYYVPAPRYYYNPRPRRSYRRQESYCSYWSRRCAANWGYGGPDYRGCMRYYRCY